MEGDDIQENLLTGVENEIQGREEEDLKSKIWRVIKNLWVLVGQSIFTRFLMSILGVITQAFVGHIGATELAAYTLVVTILVNFAQGLLSGLTSELYTLCWEAYGAKHYDMLGVHLQRSWIVSTLSATLLSPIFIFATPILKALGQDDIIAEEAGKIALWYLPVICSFIFTFTCDAYLQAHGKNKIILYYKIILYLVSFLIYIFFLWLLTMKYEYGITGVMVANLLTNLFQSIGHVIFVVSGGCPETWKGFSTLTFHNLGAVIKLSLSSGAMLCFKLWYDTITIILTGNFKNAKVAIDALAICLRISGLESMISPGLLAEASLVNVLRKGDPEAAKFCVVKVVLLSLIFGIELIILVLFFRAPLVYIFTKDHDVAVEVAHLSNLLVISILLNSVQPVLSGVAIAVGWQSTVEYVNLGCNYVFGIIFGAVLGYIFDLQVQPSFGVWTGMIISTFVQTIILIIIIQRTNWDEQISIRSNESNQMVRGAEPDDRSRVTRRVLVLSIDAK